MLPFAAMALERVDQLAAALAVMAQQYRKRANFLALAAAFAGPFDELEGVAQQLLTERLLENAVGEQLSVLERIVGQRVFVTSDEAVRKAWIRARIRLNRSSGTGEDLLEIFDLVLASPLEPRLEEWFPAALMLHVDGGELSANLVGPLAQMLQLGKAAGVGALLQWSTAADAEMFIFPEHATQLDGAHLAPASSLLVPVDSTAGFASSGTLLIDEGLPTEEEVDYSSYTDDTFTLVGTTSEDHEDRASIIQVDPPSPGLGLGDSTDPDIGGELAGVTTLGG